MFHDIKHFQSKHFKMSDLVETSFVKYKLSEIISCVIRVISEILYRSSA